MEKLIFLIPPVCLFFAFYIKAKDKNKVLVMAIIFLMPLQLGLDTGHAPGNHKTVNAIDLVLIFMILKGIPKGIRGKKIKMTASIFLPGLIYIIWAFLSLTIVSEWKLAGGFGLLSCMRAFFIGYYVANFIKNIEDIKYIVEALIYSLLFICIIGTAQYFTKSSLGLGFLGSWGMRNEQGWLRATSTFQVPNVYASYMLFLLPLTLSYVLVITKKSQKFLIMCVFTIAIFGLIVTFSRSAWLGFIISMMMFLFMFVKKPKLRKKIIPLTLVVGIVGIFVIFQFWDDIAERTLQNMGTHKFASHRRKALDGFMDVLWEVPVFGTGQWAYLTVGNATVHITVLRIAGELGIPGLLIFLWILGEIYKLSFKLARSKLPIFPTLTIGIICGYSGFMISTFFNPTYRFFSPRNLFWFYAGLLIGIQKLHSIYVKHIRQQKKRKRELLANGREIIGVKHRAI